MVDGYLEFLDYAEIQSEGILNYFVKCFRNEGIWENDFQFSTVREQTDFRILLTSLVLSGNIGKHLLNMGELARYLQNKVYIFSSNFTNFIPWRTQSSVYELGYRK